MCDKFPTFPGWQTNPTAVTNLLWSGQLLNFGPLILPERTVKISDSATVTTTRFLGSRNYLKWIALFGEVPVGMTTNAKGLSVQRGMIMYF